MRQTAYRSMKDLPSARLLGTGTPLCAGCGGLETLHEIYDILEGKTVVVNAAGCMTLLTVYPYSPFRGSWLYTSMASAPAGAQGVHDALDILLAKKRIKSEDNLNVVVLTGDGAAYGMGLSATSSAIERNLDFLYLCYDNEGYGNTGQQYSEATPHAARTATSRGPRGFPGYKKDLFAIWTAHRPAYAATVIGTEPLDLARKIEKAKDIKGPKLIIALSPCPTGWDFEPRDLIKVGRLAVSTGMWPLKEYCNGRITHTKIPHPRLSVEEYLTCQGRFRHLFHPRRNDALLEELRTTVDDYWKGVA